MVLLNICLSSTNRRIYFTPYIFDWPFIRSYAFTPVPIRPHAFTVFPGLDGLPALSLPIFILRGLPLPLTIPLPATGYMAIPLRSGFCVSGTCPMYSSTSSGSCVWVSRISRWRCGPPELPVLPLNAICSPRFTGIIPFSG